jgi:hypothetical protein
MFAGVAGQFGKISQTREKQATVEAAVNYAVAV